MKPHNRFVQQIDLYNIPYRRRVYLSSKSMYVAFNITWITFVTSLISIIFNNVYFAELLCEQNCLLIVSRAPCTRYITVLDRVTLCDRFEVVFFSLELLGKKSINFEFYENYKRLYSNFFFFFV